MKTAVDCLPCYLRQSLQVARICGDDEVQAAVVREVSRLLPDLDLERTPPENSIGVYATISRVTGCLDPYAEVKRRSNQEALALLPDLRREIARDPSPLAAAFRFSIAGNIIDYGAMHSFDVHQAFIRCRELPFAIDHSERLLARVAQLPSRSRVLYLADNCGEIAYDSLVIEGLVEAGLAVTVAVKSSPIINDALEADATACGLDRMAAIIANGTACPGTPLRLCSPEFLDAFHGADLILSKGQGNFETLSECPREIYFLLTIKCGVVGAHLAALAGLAPAGLPGGGEMVLYAKDGTSNERS